MTHEFLIELYRRFDALDAAGFASAFTPGGCLTFGNNPPVVSPARVEQALETLFALLDGISHRFVNKWPVPLGWVLEAEVTYRVTHAPRPVVVSGVTVHETAGERLANVRVYYDLAPVLAAAHGSAAPEARPVPAPVRHEESGTRGAFVLARDGTEAGRLTYSRAGEAIAILDHTEVAAEARGTGVGRALVQAAVNWAREHHVRLVPLCPYARAVFARDASIRDVLG
ncbi:MAG: GNAT family N-acetyltransferase [Vicinamibacterales bacterium]